MPHVVIVGGGFGGLNAARALAGADARVTLLDRHNYHLFQPLLYQVATASLSPGDVASPIRWILRHQKNVEVLLANVREIDPVGRRVLIDAEESMPYDYLVLASGAAHAYFGHPEWAERAPGLKTLDDALDMRRRVLLAFEAAERESDAAEQRRLLTFVIVGAGPTGVELAGALAEIARQSLRKDFRRIHPESSRIVLLEGSPYVLAPFPDPLRDAARRSLERLGVDVRTGSMVVGVDQDGVTFESAADVARAFPPPLADETGELRRGSPKPLGEGGRSADAGPKPRATEPKPRAAERISAGTVLWAAGVAASPVGRSLGVPLDRSGRVTAESTLALAAYANIFVVGDLSNHHPHTRFGQSLQPGRTLGRPRRSAGVRGKPQRSCIE